MSLMLSFFAILFSNEMSSMRSVTELSQFLRLSLMLSYFAMSLMFSYFAILFSNEMS